MQNHLNKQGINPQTLTDSIRGWALELGFSDCGIADTDLQHHERHLLNWLDDGFHGEMAYMQRHGTRRSRPFELESGTISVISVRLDYLPESTSLALDVLRSPGKAYISRYALGRDYHKMMRKRLQALVEKIRQEVGEFGFRVFVDSAPVLEKALAEKAGLGWIGKHSNLLNRDAGSWFFLGEIYTDLPLPPSLANTGSGHCGSCTACIEACPTEAIVAPYRVDARRCISYLTIELRGSIPEQFRSAIGNRIYGCDDCQLFCPWTKFSEVTAENDFLPRNDFDSSELTDLFNWTEQEFLQKTEGSAIRRIGYACWLRNIAVALGNAPRSESVIAALQARKDHPSELVREHVAWALSQQFSQ